MRLAHGRDAHHGPPSGPWGTEVVYFLQTENHRVPSSIPFPIAHKPDFSKQTPSLPGSALISMCPAASLGY